MGGDDDFWDDLLGHIQDRELVPVVGPHINVVSAGNAEQTLTTLIGQRLAKKYQLTVSPGMTMGEAVALILRERGRDELELRLYRVIKHIIRELDLAPGDALRNLAAITDLRLFVTTTPDQLLAQAVNDVRFQGRGETRELTASSKRPTREQPSNEPEPTATDVVVLSLFGQAASTRQYAIHEEDRLEWLHALLRDEAGLPDWLAQRLRAQSMLFVGCETPDWVGRFLLRMSSKRRLLAGGEEGKQFFFVGSSASYEPSLWDFFGTYCRKPLVQQLTMEPAAFVAKLRATWEAQAALRPPVPVSPPGPAAPDTPEIFISYMREDADAARRLRDAITGFCGDGVWLDESRLRAGDEWQEEISTAIRRTRLFVPIISANTEREQEGYVFREWRAAVDRARSIMGRRFIVPVVVDENYAGDPSRYQRMPPAFRDLHFGRAPAGEPDAELIAMMTSEVRDMRSSGAA